MRKLRFLRRLKETDRIFSPFRHLKELVHIVLDQLLSSHARIYKNNYLKTAQDGCYSHRRRTISSEVKKEKEKSVCVKKR